MSNKPRLCLPEHTYLVSSRCLQALDLMKKGIYKDILLGAVEMAKEKYEFEFVGYAILDDHFHFLIRTLNKEDTISRIMQYIKSRFALRFNRMNGRIGPFWNERFRDKIIEKSSHPEFLLNWLLWYFAYNAVTKGYIDVPWNYRHSSINAYLEENFYS